MPLYSVRVTLDVVVVADDQTHALELIDRHTVRDAVNDAPDEGGFNAIVGPEITSAAQLNGLLSDWNEECHPYGDTDGDTKIKDILNGSHISKPS